MDWECTEEVCALPTGDRIRLEVQTEWSPAGDRMPSMGKWEPYEQFKYRTP